MEKFFLEEIKNLEIPEDVALEIVILSSLGIDMEELGYLLAIKLERD